jgi:hypothetical protein
MSADFDSLLDEEVLKKVLVVILSIVIAVGGALFFYFQVFSRIGPPVLVQSVVTLDNKCDMPNDVFMVRVMPNGVSASFSSGTARISAMSNQRLKLVANRKYPGFDFEGDEANAAPKVTLTAICDHNSRFEETSKAMRQGFGKK